MTKPFSYIVPTSSFGQIEEVWDATGKALAKFTERAINLGVQADARSAGSDDPRRSRRQAAVAAAAAARTRTASAS